MTDQQNVLDRNNYNQPVNLPNATAALVLGIISIVGSFCYGLPGLVCGIIGLVLANKDRKLYREQQGFYSSSSLGTSNAGRVCSIIGVVLGGLLVLFFLLCLIIAGSITSWRHY